MLKKSFVVIFGSLLVAVAIWATVEYLPKLAGFMRGITPVIKPPPQDITSLSFNTTGLPLNLPPGFSIEIFAKDLPGARVMAFDGQGNLWVSLTSEGEIVMLEIEESKVVGQKVVMQDLKKPHGLVFDPQDPSILYIAEENKISKVQVDYLTPTLSDVGEGERVRLGAIQKIVDLPSGGGHFTRTIKFGPDNRLYISIGSSCNVCLEKDSRRAKIFSMNKDGSDFREYASGLRNAVFFDWSYVDGPASPDASQGGQMWATEMGRDNLGDDLPPDEINIIEEGQDYGWPYCYGKNITDPFGKASCADKSASYIDVPAHSAPLGLDFIPEEAPNQSTEADGTGYSWPLDYQGDLLVAFHGSWNRSEPTGYKVVRIKLDEHGSYEGTEDFITGWLTPEGALGRPVDILVQPGGIMYISDDKAGAIYRVTTSFSPPYQGGDGEGVGNLIFVSKPKPGEIVSSPLEVYGDARGSWYFDASFPLRLEDEPGQVIARGHAEAQDEWMTEEFVPFIGRLEFSQPSAERGFLVLEKDNPSGLPENAAELRIPVRFR